ncbi:MAG: hypothetical protein AB7L09_03695 [Nitrospira sp.]
MKGQLDTKKNPDSGSLSLGEMSASASTSSSSSASVEHHSEPNHGYIVNDPLGKHPILIKDPLSEVTRKERKAFLGVSVLAIAVMKANLLPSELSAFGVKIDNIRREWLITMLTAIVLYLLIVFMAYAFSDFLGWRIAFWEGVKKRAIERKQLVAEEADGIPDDSLEIVQCDEHRTAWSKKAIPVSIFRAFIDFGLPLFVGITAIIVLRGCA